MCASRPPKEPDDGWLLSQEPMIAAKWPATWPIDLPANASRCAVACAVGSGSSGHPGCQCHVSGGSRTALPSGPSCWTAAIGRGRGLPGCARRRFARRICPASCSVMSVAPTGLSVDMNIPPSARVTLALGSRRCPCLHSPPRTTAFASVRSLVGTPACAARAPGSSSLGRAVTRPLRLDFEVDYTTLGAAPCQRAGAIQNAPRQPTSNHAGTCVWPGTRRARSASHHDRRRYSQRPEATAQQLKTRAPTICCSQDADRFGTSSTERPVLLGSGWTSRPFSAPWLPARPGHELAGHATGLCKQLRPAAMPGNQRRIRP
jgi:hypothetical protein